MFHTVMQRGVPEVAKNVIFL